MTGRRPTGWKATADCTCWTTSISDTDEAVAACPVHRKAGREATDMTTDLSALLAHYGYRYRWEDPQFVSDIKHLLASIPDPSPPARETTPD